MLFIMSLMGSLGTWQTTGLNFPPEDLDSSGDDDDSFSGSGAGSLSVSAWDLPLQESINTSSSPSVAPDVEDHDLEAQGTETTSEDYQRIPVSPTNMHVFLVNGLVTDKPLGTGSVEEEVGVFTEQATTSSAVVTARVPVTHHTYTVRTTTSQASSTVGVIEPEVYHNVYHEVSSNDKEEPVSDIVPTTSSLDATSSTTTSLVVIKDTSSQPEEGVLPPEDGSGDQGDFVFGEANEKAEIETEIRPVEETGAGSRALHPETHDTKSAGGLSGTYG
ncbi:UNVERIFIED_CONTAM: hypothetical protein K2H54_033659 [Gekko kuhli]